MELTISQLIKIILGLAVVVLVISALSYFGSNVSDFFKNVAGGKPGELMLNFIS